MSNLRAFLVLGFAVLQMVAGFAPGLFGVTNGVGEMVEPYRTPLVPAGWAFAIWLFIYIGCLVFALFHLVNRQKQGLAVVGWLAALAFLGNWVWVLHQPTFGPGWASFLGLEVILLLALAAAWTSGRVAPGGLFQTLALGGLWALAGWITVASPAGLSLAMVFEGGWDLGARPTDAVFPIVLGWLPMAWGLTWIARRFFYAVPIMWGLFGVAMANQGEQAFVFGILALASSFAGLTLIAKSRS